MVDLQAIASTKTPTPTITTTTAETVMALMFDGLLGFSVWVWGSGALTTVSKP